MTENPYRDLLADFFSGQLANLEYADDLLATKVPHLCPDCKGSGYVGGERRRGGPLCRCPNAPSIAQLLAWGQAVATAPPSDDDIEDFADGYDFCLDRLREVKP